MKKNFGAILSDLDDTLTTDGRLPAVAYEALWKLKEKGMYLAIVSGRPASWADCLMRIFPIDAMVFENGAGLMFWDGGVVRTKNFATQSLVEYRKRLDSIVGELKAMIPSLKLAADQPFRLYDYAIDFAEERPFLSEAEINKAMDFLATQQGVTSKLSSIHINFWLGDHTKVTAVDYLIKNDLLKLGISQEDVLYCGDSPNDAPLFGYFKESVGVANVREYLEKMEAKPAYISKRAGGEGFREIVDHLS